MGRLGRRSEVQTFTLKFGRYATDSDRGRRRGALEGPRRGIMTATVPSRASGSGVGISVGRALVYNDVSYTSTDWMRVA